MTLFQRPANATSWEGLDLLASALLTLILVFLFSFFNITMPVAVPLALLSGLVSRHVFQLTFSPAGSDALHPSTMVAGYFATYFILRSFYLGSVPFFSRVGNNFYDDYLPAALWCALLGYAVFLIGMKSSFAKKSLDHWQKKIGSWPEKVPNVRILVMMLVGLASLLYLFKLGMTVGNYNNLEFQRTPPPGLPILLQNLIGLSWVAICIFLISAQRRSTRRTAWLLMGVSITLLLVNLAISGGKVALIQPLLQAAIVFHYGKRRLRLWEIVAFGVPVLIMAFGIVNFYRFVVVGHLGAPKSLSDVMSRLSSTSDLLNSKHDTAAQKPALEQMVDRDAGVDSLALIMKYTPRPFPYVYGIHWLQLPLTIIPRAIWKDKPVNMPSAEFEHTYMGQGYSFNGFSSMHLIADLYRNFSYVGVVVGMFVFGAVLRWFYVFCAPSRANGIGLFLYAALFPEIIHSLEADVGFAVIIISRAATLAVVSAIFITKQQKGRTNGAGWISTARPDHSNLQPRQLRTNSQIEAA